MTRHSAPSVTYAAFGLGITTTRPLPRLSGASTATHTDVLVELGRPPDWSEDRGLARLRYSSPYTDETGHPSVVVTERAQGRLHVFYPDGTNFWIDRTGSKVWVTWGDDLSLDDMSSYLLGPVMGLVLRLRGKVCLHASAMAMNGQAFAIVGRSGAGKSTTAAALGARGCAVLADDVVALDEAGEGFLAIPAYPRLRLSPSALGFLARLGRRIPTHASSFDQSRYHLDVTRHGYSFQPEPLPLAAVYVLDARSDRSDTPRVEPIRGADALMTLVGHSFAKALLDREMRAHDLSVLGRLASSVRVMRVTPHESPNRLPQLCDVILEELAAVAAHVA